jgi:hypothetical protein
MTRPLMPPTPSSLSPSPSPSAKSADKPPASRPPPLPVGLLIIARRGVAIRETRELVEKQRDDRVASISPELRAPLTSKAGFSEILDEEHASSRTSRRWRTRDEVHVEGQDTPEVQPRPLSSGRDDFMSGVSRDQHGRVRRRRLTPAPRGPLTRGTTAGPQGAGSTCGTDRHWTPRVTGRPAGLNASTLNSLPPLTDNRRPKGGHLPSPPWGWGPCRMAQESAGPRASFGSGHRNSARSASTGTVANAVDVSDVPYAMTRRSPWMSDPHE